MVRAKRRRDCHVMSSSSPVRLNSAIRYGTLRLSVSIKKCAIPRDMLRAEDRSLDMLLLNFGITSVSDLNLRRYASNSSTVWHISSSPKRNTWSSGSQCLTAAFKRLSFSQTLRRKRIEDRPCGWKFIHSMFERLDIQGRSWAGKLFIMSEGLNFMSGA